MSRRMSARGALVGLLLASAAVPAVALEQSGNAIRVDPAVNANGTGGQRLLELEGAVFMGDEIVAGPNGLAQIKFIDDTRLVIGPNSRLKIDTFVFNPNNTAKKVTISALRGTFRFITGKSPHDAYSIRTPTMTIGVRGTVVDISVGSRNSSAIFQEGGGNICGSGGCVSVQHTCQIWVAPRNGELSQSMGVDRQRRLAVSFPFNEDQSALAPDFQVNRSCDVADPRFYGTPRAEKEADRSTSSPSSPPPPPPPPPPSPPPPTTVENCEPRGEKKSKNEGERFRGYESPTVLASDSTAKAAATRGASSKASRVASKVASRRVPAPVILAPVLVILAPARSFRSRPRILVPALVILAPALAVLALAVLAPALAVLAPALVILVLALAVLAPAPVVLAPAVLAPALVVLAPAPVVPAPV